MKKAELFSELMLERFWSKVEKTSTCWNWKGAKNIHGGLIRVDGKMYRPNRISFNISFGEIPQNKVILQTCKNLLCVNPEHLILANKQNQEVKKTHCPKGHPYSGVNNQGKRICQPCMTERMRIRYSDPNTGQANYQKNYNKSNKGKVNEASKKWRRENKPYFREYERNNPRSGSHLSLEERLLMTERRRLDGNRCQWDGCKKSGKGISVHHIFPRAEYPNLPLELRFLISYCVQHHSDFHKARGDPYWSWILANEGEYE